MWDTVTGLTLGFHSVHRAVTEDTGQLRMLGLAGLQGLHDLPVTGSTETIGNIVSVGNLRGLVRLVTPHTILKGLPLEVRIVTVKTVGDVTVPGMTEIAGLLGMSAGNLLHLFPRTGMTGKTGLLVLSVFKGNFQGGVGIGMTLKTIFQGEMGFTPVTS